MRMLYGLSLSARAATVLDESCDGAVAFSTGFAKQVWLPSDIGNAINFNTLNLKHNHRFR